MNLRNLDRNTHEYFYAFVSNPGAVQAYNIYDDVIVSVGEQLELKFAKSWGLRACILYIVSLSWDYVLHGICPS